MGDGITYPVRFMDEDAESLLGGEDRQHDTTFRPTVMNGGRQHVILKPYHDDLEEDDEGEDQEIFTRLSPERPRSDDEVVVSYERSPQQQNGGQGKANNQNHTIIDFAWKFSRQEIKAHQDTRL